MLHILALDKHIIRLSIDSDIQNQEIITTISRRTPTYWELKGLHVMWFTLFLEFQQIYTSEIIVVNIPISDFFKNTLKE